MDLDVGPGVRCFVTNQSAGASPRAPATMPPRGIRSGGRRRGALPAARADDPLRRARYHQRSTINLEPGGRLACRAISSCQAEPASPRLPSGLLLIASFRN